MRRWVGTGRCSAMRSAKAMPPPLDVR